MNTSENFALMIRPITRAYFENKTLTLGQAKRGQWSLNCWDRTNPKGEVHANVDSEEELWTVLRSAAPDMLQKLRESASLELRGLHARCELFKALGGAGVDTRQEDLQRLMGRCNELLIEALGAKRLTKVKSRFLRVQRSRTITPWWTRTQIQLPFYAQVTPLTLKMFPSSLNNSDWSVKVSLYPETNDGLLETQRRLEEVAYPWFKAEGVIVKDTTQGTYLDF